MGTAFGMEACLALEAQAAAAPVERERPRRRASDRRAATGPVPSGFAP